MRGRAAIPDGRRGRLAPHDQFLVAVLWRVRRRIVAEVAAAILANLATVAMAVLAGGAAARLEGGGRALWGLVALVAGIGLVEAAASALQQVQAVRAAVDVFVSNRRAVVEVAHREGPRLGGLGTEASLLAVGTTDSEHIDVLVHLFGSLAGAAVGAVAIAAAATVITPLLGLTVALTSLAAAAAMARCGGSLWRAGVRAAATTRQFTATASATIDGYETVAGLGMVDAAVDAAAVAADAARAAACVQQELEARLAAIGRLAGAGVAVAIAWLVSGDVGRWTTADAIAAVALLGGLVPVLAQLAAALGMLFAARASAQPMALLLRPSSSAKSPGPSPESSSSGSSAAGPIRPAIEVAGVVVRRGARRLLDGASLTVHDGERVLVCGPTGSGKTVLLHLLDGTRRPDAGWVAVHGVDPWPLDPAARATRLALAEQHPFAWDDTIAFNVGLGRATGDSVGAALYLAAAEELPATVGGRAVGRRGRAVSGGQRRRLTVARAFATGAPVVLLDDPTASLDAATEARLLDRVLAHRSRTVLLTGNSAAAARRVDRIVVLGRGRVVAIGRYEDLLARSPEFRALMEPTVAVAPEARP